MARLTTFRGTRLPGGWGAEHASQGWRRTRPRKRSPDAGESAPMRRRRSRRIHQRSQRDRPLLERSSRAHLETSSRVDTTTGRRSSRRSAGAMTLAAHVDRDARAHLVSTPSRRRQHERGHVVASRRRGARRHAKSTASFTRTRTSPRPLEASPHDAITSRVERVAGSASETTPPVAENR
jgi:hypothetical protein